MSHTTAVLTRDRLNEIAIAVTTPRPAVLVLNDSWAPGWKAWVDGRTERMLQVNSVFRGVVVPVGRHEIVFRYRPGALMIGLWLSGGSLVLLTIAGAWLGQRRRGWRTPERPR